MLTRSLMTIMVLLISSPFILGQEKTEENTIRTEDVHKLLGDWTGMLTYVDYKTDNPISIPCDLKVVSKGKGETLSIRYIYPEEPVMNSRSRIKIGKDRKSINGNLIKSRTIGEDGNIHLVTEEEGMDGNGKEKAQIKITYSIGKDAFVIKKEVLFEDGLDWKKRNQYTFKRMEE